MCQTTARHICVPYPRNIALDIFLLDLKWTINHFWTLHSVHMRVISICVFVCLFVFFCHWTKFDNTEDTHLHADARLRSFISIVLGVNLARSNIRTRTSKKTRWMCAFQAIVEGNTAKCVCVYCCVSNDIIEIAIEVSI